MTAEHTPPTAERVVTNELACLATITVHPAPNVVQPLLWASAIVEALRSASLLRPDTPPPSERSSDALRIDMVHELCTALHGNSWARPDPPAAVWRQLLNEVEDLAGELVAGSDDSTDTLIEQLGERLISVFYAPGGLGAVVEYRQGGTALGFTSFERADEPRAALRAALASQPKAGD